ncbi:superoxide dismutase[Cu-Zn] [Williamsia deligens]|uniref:Superoxide dismutase [Cu-Zn] n=1 Tax=Williamsia deligens TaxID=321325 RepID=A0ABW3G6E9_9NOCA|nr:superoxide dismutase family protein [Williamsia deligens]MCP2193172.1 superoxide dismutase, Cu-Zn family [Williamsia deligens]
MTFQPTTRRTVRRVVAAMASAAAVGAVVAGCSPDEQPSSTPGTTPAVITGDQAPGGLGEGESGGSVSASQQSGSEGSSGSSSSSGLTASLISPSGAQVGSAKFTSAGSNAVRVDVTVTSGVTPGFHGMHIHSVGKCENNSTAPTGGAPGAFLSAGGHLQVDGRTGHPSSGDLVSILVDGNGRGETVTTTDAVSLSDITGKAIIIHSGPDNFANIPTRYAPAPDSETLSTGDAGSRVACGVIGQG